ncbi:hypothetical protein [Actinacidiphila guanduensis]|uniref:Lipopolysaccharide assembly protein A domain-containing protein n=1 Tax=Actinacidiphila guanduensis TaxID=310781 RepID=A0A1G9ZQR1_9ACTN|nr:hypothetical protein [Actinacidiphila guanduensis]SDN22943.1 hypothetical protein SAMN05216259_103240 [Actinacidiphila guanduensis]
MLVLGLLLLACTAAFTGLAISDNLGGGPDYSVTVMGNHIATMNGLALFCAGLALALVFSLGCAMAMAGGLLHRRRSRKYRAVRRDAAATARERDHLAARLDETQPVDTAPEYTPEGGGANRVETEPARPRHHARHLFGH